jgi:predicted nucleic acid-binding protein
MLVISDTSALSALAEAGMMPILPKLFPTVVITASIEKECAHAGAPDELRQWIAQPPAWLKIVPDPSEFLLETASLGAGEASAISLAWEHRQKASLILDERRGRAVAKALGLSISGTMAIVAEAARQGHVQFEDALGLLQAAGFRLSAAIIEEARRKSRQPI